MLLSLFGKLFSKKELINFSVLKTDMHSHLIPEQPLLTFGDNYILIEVSMGVKEKLLEEVIFELTTRNIKPILAHAERYPYMYANNSLDYYDTLRNADVLLQVNLRSF